MGLLVRILRVRPAILAPITVVITLIGVHTVDNDVFDIVLVIVVGALGHQVELGFDPGRLVLAFALGAHLEGSLRRSLLLEVRSAPPTGELADVVLRVAQESAAAVICHRPAQALAGGRAVSCRPSVPGSARGHLRRDRGRAPTGR